MVNERYRCHDDDGDYDGEHDAAAAVNERYRCHDDDGDYDGEDEAVAAAADDDEDAP